MLNEVTEFWRAVDVARDLFAGNLLCLFLLRLAFPAFAHDFVVQFLILEDEAAVLHLLKVLDIDEISRVVVL